MRLIDGDKFLKYLIFSKHIDSLKCGEVKEALKMCEVNAEVCDDELIKAVRANEFYKGYKKATEQANGCIEQIRAEIESWFNESARYVRNYDAYKWCLDVIDKYTKGEQE